MFDFILSNKNKYERLFNSNSHAILLETKDTMLSFNLALLFCMNLNCKSQNKPCKICSNCLKIINSNSLDTFIYPKEKTFLAGDANEIIENLSIVPAENEFKVYIIKDFDEVSEQVQNKLLKSIEEPPKYVKFILLTKEKQKVLPTILSRCEVISVPKFTDSELENYLSNFPSEKRKVIIESSNGNLTIATKLINEESFIENYNLALDILLNLTSSKQILKFTSRLEKNRESFIEVVLILQNLIDDIIKINEKKESLVINKYCLNQLKIVSQSYSTKACIKIENLISECLEKLNYNVSLNSVIDYMLLKILEEKWQNKM